MLFHSSIRKELARSFGATLVVLVTIVMTMILIRTLSLASRGSVNPSDVLLVMGFSVLANLPTILTLSLFISIVGSLSRMYRDSEMVIWFASGRGLLGFLSPLLRFAWPVLLVISMLALAASPWANRQSRELKDRYERRGDIERVSPGQFQESSSGKRVFFIDKDSPDGKSGRNVFISSIDNGKESVTSARDGRIETLGQDRFLMLNAGQRLEKEIGGTELRISEFEEYGARVDSALVTPRDDLPARTQSTLVLLTERNRFQLAELGWRVGLALAALNLVLVGLAVANANPRGGLSGNLLFALFAFVIYFNLLNLGQSWVLSGRVGLAGCLLLLHGSALALALGWLIKRHNHWSWRHRLRTALAGRGTAA